MFGAPAFAEVLLVRQDRVGTVRALLVGVTADEQTASRRNPWAPEHTETVLSCLHVIRQEEWEHPRYSVRDLDAIAAAAAGAG